jgi:DNA-binding protein Alba
MDTLLVGEKDTNEYVSQAKEILEKHHKVIIKGNGRDTVKAVDVAELLKIHNYKVHSVSINTEEEKTEEKTIRTSTILIELIK